MPDPTLSVDALRAEADHLRRKLAAVEAEIAALDPEQNTARTALEPIAPAMPVAILLRSRRRLRVAALSLYRLVRPVMRPLAWRSRLFLTGELMTEMADLRAKQDLMLAQMQTQLQVRAGADAAGLGRAAERLLLTLALEPRQRSD